MLSLQNYALHNINNIFRTRLFVFKTHPNVRHAELTQTFAQQCANYACLCS